MLVYGVFKMSNLLFDIETDNLLWSVTQIWCVSTQDIDSGEKNFYPTYAIHEAIVALRAAESLSGHNILGFDLPVIWKLFGKWDNVPLILDTLVVSRGLFPERPGGHSLAAWGEKLGVPKIEFNDFTQYTEEMGLYCQQDVEVNIAVLKALNKEMEEQYGTTLPAGYKVYS